MVTNNTSVDTDYNSLQVLQVKDMSFQIICAICACVFNLITFLIFYFLKSKRSILMNLMMYMSLSESICYYCIIMVLSDLPYIVQALKIRTIFSYMTFSHYGQTDTYFQYYFLQNKTIFKNNPEDTFNPKLYSLSKINNSIYSAGLTTSLLLQIFACVEVFCIFKYPISDFSKRYNVYYYLTVFLTIFSYLFSYFFLVDNAMRGLEEQGYNQLIHIFWNSQSFNAVCLILFILVGTLSLIYTISILRNKSKFYSKEKVLFCIRHFIYLLTYLGLWIYPIYVLASQKIYDVKVIIFLMNLAGLLLSIFRLLEFCNCISLCKMSGNNPQITHELNPASVFEKYETQDNEKNNKEHKDSNITSTTKRDSNTSDDKPLPEGLSKKPSMDMNQEHSLSQFLTNSFLIEYMYYIIEGILNIGTEIDNRKGNPYLIHNKCYSEVVYHNFNQINIKSVEDLENLPPLSIKSKSSLSTSKLQQILSMINVCDGNISLIEYIPKVFRNVLMLDSLNFEELEKSFKISKNLDNLSKMSISEGKSGSFFFFTYDNRFIIKTISQTELCTMLEEFIKPYYELVTENYNTLLVRTYGVYTLAVGLSRITIILMENISPISDAHIIRRFDLKGSLLGRKTKNLNLNNKNKTLKDIDFLEVKRIYPGLIGFEEKSIISILETITHDLNLLRNSNIMDYSFLLIIAENKGDFDINMCLMHNRLHFSRDEKYLYFVGIIDYLTKFTSYKQIENKLKTLMNYSKRETISAVNPVLYADRYAKFIIRELFSLTK